MKPQSKSWIAISKTNGDHQSLNRPETKRKARKMLIANRRGRRRHMWRRAAQLELAKDLASCGDVRREAETLASGMDRGTFAVAAAKHRELCSKWKTKARASGKRPAADAQSNSFINQTFKLLSHHFSDSNSNLTKIEAKHGRQFCFLFFVFSGNRGNSCKPLNTIPGKFSGKIRGTINSLQTMCDR